MANYGFTTYDPQTQRIVGIVNSKFPIFGPRYDQIARCFKTFHLSDTSSLSYQTASLSLPSAVAGSTTKNEYHAYIKTLIKQVKHSFKKTPMGYCSIVGSVVKNTKMSLAFSNVSEWTSGQFPASFSTTGTKTTGSFPVISAAGESLREATTPGSISHFANNYMRVAKTSSAETNIVVPNNYPLTLNGGGDQIIPGNNSSTPDLFYDERLPYTVEADDEYIYFYRWAYWCDIWSRYYEDTYSAGTHIYWDERARSKGVIDYAGSEVDFTIYLCPYTMEDLLPTTPISPSSVGEWDADYWDGGKVWG